MAVAVTDARPEAPVVAVVAESVALAPELGGVKVTLADRDVRVEGPKGKLSTRLPEGIKIDSPDPTHITVHGPSKQKVGQVAAEIRAFRPPEPYKGKGVKYEDEVILRKEGKKK